MSILVDAGTRLVVQAITGRDGAFHTAQMIFYGTRVVAGVTPGKGGLVKEGVPVFDSVAAALEATGANTSIIFVPAPGAADAIMESATAGIGLVVCLTEGIPIHDMVRVELDPNGQFNITEFGTVKDPEQFKALFAYSPYHHVRDGVKYPAVLLTTGDNDGRVNPAQSRKMAARLQAATGSDRPILFRSTPTAGHGIGSSLKDRIAEQADVLAFLFDQLGVDASRWAFH